MAIVLENSLREKKFFKTKKDLINTLDTIVLTEKEYNLLFLLVANKNTLVKYATVLTEVWDEDNRFNRRSMQVYKVKLKARLKDFPIKICTIHDKGIILKM